MGWLAGWKYRKSHVINSASGAGTGYPVQVTVYYGSGTDSGGSVYLAGKCRTDFGDVRFTSSDGSTELSYWLESYTSGSSATFWVRVSEDLSSSNRTIYIYYGNSTATTTSNALTTGVLSAREYKVQTYTPEYTASVSSGVFGAYSTTSGLGSYYLFAPVPKSYLQGRRVSAYWRWYGDWAGGTYSLIDCYIVNGIQRRNVLTGEFTEGNGHWYPITYFSPNTIPVSCTATANGGWISWREDTSGTLDLSSYTNDIITLGFHLRDSWTSNTVHGEIDYIKIKDAGNNDILTLDLTGYAYVAEVSGTTYDYGLVRKYVSPEPSHGAWGSEQSVPSGLKVRTSSGTVTLCLVPQGDGAPNMGGVPRIRLSGAVYDLYLVETSDPNASPVRIRTSTGVKAVRKA